MNYLHLILFYGTFFAAMLLTRMLTLHDSLLAARRERPYGH